MQEAQPSGAPQAILGSLPPYSFTNVWGLGWSRWKASFLPLFLGTLIVVAVYVPLTLADAAMGVLNQVAVRPEATESVKSAQGLMAGLAGLSGCFTLLWSLFVVYPIYAGFVWMGVQAARGTAPSVGSILQGYRRFPTVIGGYVLITVICLVPFLLAIAVPIPLLLSQSAWDLNRLRELFTQTETWETGFIIALVIVAVWIAVCVVLLYWIALRVIMWIAVAVDETGPRRGAWASINRSWQITRGSALSLFGLMFTAGLVAVFTLVLCCVPYLLVGVPLFVTLFGLAYATLNQQAMARDASAHAAQ
jgi:uncharacterized membrane protein